jgi:hypothetical protein
MVGGGGVPSLNHNICLGDIVVSISHKGWGGVVQYDLGKTIQGQNFQATGSLDQSFTVLRAAVNRLQFQYESEGHRIVENLNDIFETKPRLRKKYQRPDLASNRLYHNQIVYTADSESPCDLVCGDESACFVSRHPRTEDEDNPAIHYGLIAINERCVGSS